MRRAVRSPFAKATGDKQGRTKYPAHESPRRGATTGETLRVTHCRPSQAVRWPHCPLPAVTAYCPPFPNLTSSSRGGPTETPQIGAPPSSDMRST